MCEGVGFKYSSVDWDVIPRLRQSGHDPDGHYAPVFFDPRALLKYVIRPEYPVRRFRDGGIVRFDNGAELKYGITRAGRMVCWLGELDGIPEQEQHYLLSDNLESDHDVASWLYRDRLGLPPEPPAERQLAEAFLHAVRIVCGELKCDVWALRDKEIQALHSMERPVVWNEYVSYAINRLYKALIDTADRALVVDKLYDLGERPKHPGSKFRCLVDLLESQFGVNHSPGFKQLEILYDWRNSLDHASPGIRGEVPDWRLMRLAPPNHGYERAYDEMLAGLIGVFRHITCLAGAPAVDRGPPAPKPRGSARPGGFRARGAP
ncbi:MAG: hypothetical protein OXU25_01695 [Thaumarchaeota archaeon]|nr:hypothetical protein [Nitrososphaerota archaeon]